MHFCNVMTGKLANEDEWLKFFYICFPFFFFSSVKINWLRLRRACLLPYFYDPRLNCSDVITREKKIWPIRSFHWNYLAFEASQSVWCSINSSEVSSRYLLIQYVLYEKYMGADGNGRIQAYLISLDFTRFCSIIMYHQT